MVSDGLFVVELMVKLHYISLFNQHKILVINTYFILKYIEFRHQDTT